MDSLSRGTDRSDSWRLLTACARHAAGLTDAQAVGEAAERVVDWQTVEARAREHGLLPWLARGLTETGLAGGAREPIIAAASAVAGRTLGQVRQLGELCALFGAAGIPVLPYKGPALSLQLYGDVALRQSVDLDLVVPQHCYARAREVLVQQGLPPRSGHSARQERTLFAWLGHAPFGGGDSFVELHWRFADRRFAFALTAEQALARASTASVGPYSYALMAPDDLLAVLSMHGTRHLYEHLEWLAGVTRLLRSAADDASHLMSHAEALRARRMLAVSVRMAERLLGFPITEAWRAELERDSTSATLSQQMADELERHELHGQPFLEAGRLQKRYADLVDTRFDRVRLFAHAMLDPTVRDQEALSLPDALMPLHRVIRPLRLATAFLARRLQRPRTS